MKLIGRVIVTIIGLLILAGTAREVVGDNPKVRKVVPIDGREFEIPSDTPKEPFAVTRALLKQTAYLPWYQRCILSQAERLLTPVEAERLGDLTEHLRQQRELRLFFRAEPYCESAHRDVVDPAGSPGEIAPIRAATAGGLKAFVKSEGFSVAEQRCIGSKIYDMRDAEIIELANAPESTQVSILRELFESCQ